MLLIFYNLVKFIRIIKKLKRITNIIFAKQITVHNKYLILLKYILTIIILFIIKYREFLKLQIKNCTRNY